ncbi:cleavage stimulating factor 64-like isoform X2 [Asparagus officinalis]|uniref:cleavage stimulating factor 64-like isoform X2 n=1 Tax=Asparagus officinalis TaxID=4686 RepID=UPI00098E112D|nr:cleavage stimulating factor 64-like isoform X2 [Asparagus officinalis]
MASQHRCVFVGNIPYDATEEQLIQICEEVGPVVSFRLVLDRETGKPKGYGFCEYRDEETALSARRNLQGYEINGRQLRVDFAENDKGTDRNREQGRGGPGSSVHQPIGHPLAAAAASSMARALSGTQTSKSPLMQNGMQNLLAPGNDSLTQYLAKMSRQHLTEIMSEMKALAQQNNPLVQRVLRECPQLAKALFQAQIMLGMVTPEMMQMASSAHRPALKSGMPSQNALIPLQSLPVQPPFQQTLPPQPQTLLQGTVPGKSAITVQPQSFGGLPSQPELPPLPTSKNLISQVQPSVLQQTLPPHLASQGASSKYPLLSNGLNSLPNETGTYAAGFHDLNRVSHTSETGDRLEGMNHPSKRPRIEDGSGSRLMVTHTFATSSSVPVQPVVTGSVPGTQMTNAQLPPELESALLQQVMNLTPEQLSSLPLEQQQQVRQLQQMLAKQNL